MIRYLCWLTSLCCRNNWYGQVKKTVSLWLRNNILSTSQRWIYSRNNLQSQKREQHTITLITFLVFLFPKSFPNPKSFFVVLILLFIYVFFFLYWIPKNSINSPSLSYPWQPFFCVFFPHTIPLCYKSIKHTTTCPVWLTCSLYACAWNNINYGRVTLKAVW